MEPQSEASERELTLNSSSIPITECETSSGGDSDTETDVEGNYDIGGRELSFPSMGASTDPQTSFAQSESAASSSMHKPVKTTFRFIQHETDQPRSEEDQLPSQVEIMDLSTKNSRSSEAARPDENPTAGEEGSAAVEPAATAQGRRTTKRKMTSIMGNENKPTGRKNAAKSQKNDMGTQVSGRMIGKTTRVFYPPAQNTGAPTKVPKKRAQKKGASTEIGIQVSDQHSEALTETGIGQALDFSINSDSSSRVQASLISQPGPSWQGSHPGGTNIASIFDIPSESSDYGSSPAPIIMGDLPVVELSDVLNELNEPLAPSFDIPTASNTHEEMPSGNIDQESSTSCEPNSSPYVDPIERGVVIDVPTIHHSQPLTVRLPEEMLRDGGEVTLRLTGGNLTVSKTNASEVKAKRKHEPRNSASARNESKIKKAQNPKTKKKSKSSNRKIKDQKRKGRGRRCSTSSDTSSSSCPCSRCAPTSNSCSDVESTSEDSDDSQTDFRCSCSNC